MECLRSPCGRAKQNAANRARSPRRKPLYYYIDTNRLIFASEIKALLAHADVDREVDPHGVLNYFAYGHAVGKDTIYKGIRKLLPGHLLRVRDGEIDIRRWWNAAPGQSTTRSPSECAAEVRRLLEDSVRLRLISDVPLGAFLSGGLDSSAVVAIMARQMGRPVQTFSIGFDFGAAFNEYRMLAESPRIAVQSIMRR